MNNKNKEGRCRGKGGNGIWKWRTLRGTYKREMLEKA
jgi:hypothetical protein